MNKIEKRVSQAQSRLLIGRFFRIFCWSMFAGLLVSAIGLAIPKIWHIVSLDAASAYDTWVTGWLIGGVSIGLLVAATMAWLGRESRLNAAVEIDQRFGLKERLSSALTLDEKTSGTDAGKALLNDANERADTIDVRDQFGYQPTWRALLPLVPAIMIGILLFVPNAAMDVTTAKENITVRKKEAKNAIEQAKKKIEKRAKEMQAKGLKDALAKLDTLEKKIDNLNGKNEGEKKDALVKLNDVKKAVEDRQRELGSPEEMKKQLSKLDEVSKGPAKKIADAMKAGDFKQAQKAIKDLADKLKSDKLSDTQKKQLAKDLNQLADQMKKMAQKHEQMKKDLKDQIKKAQQQGNLDKAAKLQQKLDQMQKQNKQQKKMQQMADKLKKCADCMGGQKQGNGQKKGGSPKQGGGEQKSGGQQGGDQPSQQQMQDAADALKDLAEQMDQLEKELQDMEDLEDLSQDLQNIKNAMQGCDGCEGGKDDKPNWNDWAKGAGKGGGKRAKEEEETGGYKSNVKAKLRKGETIVTGSADGNNITGKSISEAKSIVENSLSKDSDPLENQKLPRSQRDHAGDYFKQMRGN